MGSHDNPAEKAPPPKTVLSEARTGLRDEKQRLPGLNVKAYRSSDAFADRLRRTEDRTLALDEIKALDVEAMVIGATIQNQQASKNAANRMFGPSPLMRRIGREIDNVATINRDGYADYRPKKAVRDSYRAQVADLNEQGAAFRQATGFGVSLPKSHRVNLLDQDGRVLAELPQTTAAALARDPRVRPGLRLLQLASRGEAPADLAVAATAAIEAASEGHKIGDAWLFKTNEERVAAIETAFKRLAASKPGEPAYRQAFQLLAMTVLAEALPQKQTLQLFMDMAPGLGNARAVEGALRSGEAAIAAFARGDDEAGRAHLIDTAFNVFGAVGGPITLGAAATSKAVRATVRRRLNDMRTRFEEMKLAATSSRDNAAVKRTESYARRTIGAQLDEQAKQARDTYLSTLPENAAMKIKQHLMYAIGDAGEFYFEPIFQRIHPKMISQAQVTRLRAAGHNNDANTMEGMLKRIRDQREIIPDAELVGYIVSGNGRLLEISKAGGQIHVQPLALNIKTGAKNYRQEAKYRRQADTALPPSSDPPTISGHLNIHIRPEEWKQFLTEALDYRMNAIRDDLLAANLSPNKVRDDLAKLLDVADMDRIFAIALVENVAGAAARVDARASLQFE